MIIVDAGNSCAFYVHLKCIFHGGIRLPTIDIPKQGGSTESIIADIISKGYQGIELILHEADCKHFAELVFDYTEIIHQEVPDLLIGYSIAFFNK